MTRKFRLRSAVCSALALGLATGALAAMSDFSSLHEFAGGSEGGRWPMESPIPVGGVLYGMTQLGGTNNQGVIYRLSSDGSNYAVIHSFGGYDGKYPCGGLTHDEGFLYGLCPRGGAHNAGVLFRLAVDGSGFAVQHEFDDELAADGAMPLGGLIEASNVLYGMTYYGGASKLGMIFRIDVNGSGFQNLHSFAGGFGDGKHPSGNFLLDGTTLYGVTAQGGTNDAGVVFAIEADGSNYRNLHEFDNETGGGNTPFGTLTKDGEYLHGMALGGWHKAGVAYCVRIDGQNFGYTHQFTGEADDGAAPVGSLLRFDSKLFGLSRYGGAGSRGALFSIGDAYTNRYNWPLGGEPLGDLQEVDGFMYGSTLRGGAQDIGTVFRFEADSNAVDSAVRCAIMWIDGGEMGSTDVGEENPRRMYVRHSAQNGVPAVRQIGYGLTSDADDETWTWRTMDDWSLVDNGSYYEFRGVLGSAPAGNYYVAAKFSNGGAPYYPPSSSWGTWGGTNTPLSTTNRWTVLPLAAPNNAQAWFVGEHEVNVGFDVGGHNAVIFRFDGSMSSVAWGQPAGAAVGTPNWGHSISAVYDGNELTSCNMDEVQAHPDFPYAFFGVQFDQPQNVSGVRWKNHSNYWNCILRHKVWVLSDGGDRSVPGDWIEVVAEKDSAYNWNQDDFGQTYRTREIRVIYSQITGGWASDVYEMEFAVETQQELSLPVNGTSYVVGSNYAGLGICVYQGANPPFRDEGLDTNTPHYYYIFTENNGYYSGTGSLIPAQVPSALESYPTGDVSVCDLQVDRRWPPTSLADMAPKYSWRFGDSMNNGSLSSLAAQAVNFGFNSDVAMGDVTGDGRPDLVAVQQHVHPGCFDWVLINNGGDPISWSSVRLTSAAHVTVNRVALGDLTGDGRLDVVLACGAQNYVAINNGGSPSTWARVNLGSAFSDSSSSLAVADIDGDGRLDVVVGNTGQQNAVLLNNGGSPETWSRVDLGSALSDATTSIAAGDVNGDARTDVVVANAPGQNYVLVNNGGSPDTWSRVNLGSVLADNTTSLAVGDLDGDGLPDVVVGNSGEQIYALINNGGSPDAWTRRELGPDQAYGPLDAALADVNGDGRLDAVFADFHGYGAGGMESFALLNNGSDFGSWSRVVVLDTQLINGRVKTGDVDLDGRCDIVFCGFNASVHVLRNTAASMPFIQRAYRIQVSRVEGDWSVENQVWDSGIVLASDAGDGVSTVRQGLPSVDVGSYFWRIKLFSTSGYQGEWSAPKQYDLAAGQVYLGVWEPVEPPAIAYTTNSQVRVVGAVSSYASDLVWSNLTTLSGGSVSLASIWTQDVGVVEGDNIVRFTAEAAGGLAATQELHVVYYDAPSVAITRPNGGSDVVLHTNRVVLAGEATAGFGLQQVCWTNLSTGVGGLAAIDGSAASSWTISGITLSGDGAETCLVWAVDNQGHVSVPQDIVLSWQDTGVPADFDSFLTGAVWAVELKADNLSAPVTLGDRQPKFSWGFGDALNGGQTPAFQFNDLGSPLLGDHTLAVAAGDVNGDGRVDVVVGNSAAIATTQNFVIVNNGGSPASWPRYPLGSWLADATRAVVVADVTGDGLADVVVGNFNQQNYLVVNNGGSPESWARVNLGSALSDATCSLDATDVNGDGLLDVVVGNSGGQNYVLTNNGGSADTWTRVNLGSALSDATMSVKAADLTGDGLPDVAVGNAGAQNYVLVNNGGSADTWTRVNLGSALSDSTYALALGDVTGDGLIDAAAANHVSQPPYVLVNNGSGDPSSWERIAVPGAGAQYQAHSIAMGDMNGDGLLDLILGTDYDGPASSVNRILLNNGGRPDTWPALAVGTEYTYSLAVADFNGDGRLDYVTGNGMSGYGNRNYVWMNASTSCLVQAAYRIQVAKTSSDWSAGNLAWDSGVVPSTEIGNGQSSVMQAAAFTNGGVYYWHVKVFSVSGFQSDWTVPQQYEIPTGEAFFVVERPTPPTGYVSGVSCDVSGWASWGIGSVDWTNQATGGNGTFAANGSWTQTVALAEGHNSVTFAAHAGEETLVRALDIVRVPGLPILSIRTPEDGQSFTTTAAAVSFSGAFEASADYLVPSLMWSNEATGVYGMCPISAGATQWPGSGVVSVELMKQADNRIRVWCEAITGETIDDEIVVGCFDYEAPQASIAWPNGGNDLTIYTNVIGLAGTASDNGLVQSVVCSNATAGSLCEVALSRSSSGGTGVWQVAAITLAPGAQEFLVWAVDAFGNSSSTQSMILTFDVGGLPPDPAAYSTGLVSVTDARANNRFPPVLLDDPRPSFSWKFGDELNRMDPGQLARVNLGAAQEDYTAGVALGDLDEDGWLDVVLANAGLPWGPDGSQNCILFGGEGSVDAWPRTKLGSDLDDYSMDAAIGDLTGDGRPDVVVGNQGQNYVLINRGRLATTWQRLLLGSPLGDDTSAVAIDDLTGDGRPDVVVGNNGYQNYVLVNNGNSPETWSRVSLGSDTNDWTYDVATGDVTGDGRPDVIVGNYLSRSFVLVNNGGSPDTWNRVNLGDAENESTTSVGLGDLNGDGLLDVVIAGFTAPICALLNNGGTPDTWQRTALADSNGQHYKILLADLTGDGRLDILDGRYPVAEHGTEILGENRVYINNAGSPEAWSAALLGSSLDDCTHDLAVGDLDRDGRLDVVVANYASAFHEGRNQQNYALMNAAGNMRFVQSGYRIQVVASTDDFVAGPYVWDSGVAASQEMGDGIGSIEQGVDCPAAGNYYWRLKAFSESGYQSDWTEAFQYSILAGEIYLSLENPSPSYPAYVTNSPCPVSGWASWNVAQVDWTNAANGAYGSFAPVGRWTQNVVLASGSNDVAFTASEAGGLAVTQIFSVVYMTAIPAIAILAPNSGVSYTTALQRVEFRGELQPPYELLGNEVRWSNETAGVGGSITLISGQSEWVVSSSVALQANANNRLRVWCDTILGWTAEAQMTVGCYDAAAPSVSIEQGGGSGAIPVCSNRMALSGWAVDNGRAASVAWVNRATGAEGVVNLSWAYDQTSGWWNVPAVELLPGAQDIDVWATDDFGNGSATSRLVVTYVEGGLVELGSYPTGAVRATNLKVNGLACPALGLDIAPKYSWNFGDAVNQGSLAGMSRRTPGVMEYRDSRAISIGDLNNDGRPDLAIGGSQTLVVLNQGNDPSNWPSVGLAGGGGTCDLEITDLTGDGRPDIVAGNSVFIDNGASPETWTRRELGPPYGESTQGVDVGDLNGDGRPDVVEANDGQNYVLFNTGLDFESWPRVNLGGELSDYTFDAVIADLTGDGLPDVAAANYGQQNYVLVNNGGSPDTWARVRLGPVVSGNSTCLHALDVNGDGRLDVILGDQNHLHVLLNNGASPSTWTCDDLADGAFMAAWGIRSADINGDGLLDLVVAGAAALLNNGGDVTSWPAVAVGSEGTSWSKGLAVGDLTGDGRPEVCLANDGYDYVFLNDAAVMPESQQAYRLQVARTEADLASGNFYWDSGVVESPLSGDGFTGVAQGAPCIEAGAYWWRVKVFSSSGFQSDWTTPALYEIPTNGLYLTIRDPAQPQAYVVGASCDVAGWVSKPNATLAWTNLDSGASFEGPVSGLWTQTISTASGTNRLVFTAQSASEVVTQQLSLVLVDTPPVLSIEGPGGGADHVSASRQVRLWGSLTGPFELLENTVYWSNRTSGAFGALSRSGSQARWPVEGDLYLVLTPQADNEIRVWCNTQFGIPAEDEIVIGCYDAAAPELSITQPDSDQTTIYSNHVALGGWAQDNGAVAAVMWRDSTAPAAGMMQINWAPGQTNGSWRTPVLTLDPGAHDIRVWAVDAFGNSSATDVVSVVYLLDAAPGALGASPTGLVFVSDFRVDGRLAPAQVANSQPVFGWKFGDGFNTGFQMAFVEHEVAQGYWADNVCMAIGDLNGDGRPDAVIGLQNGQNLVYLNNGLSPEQWTRLPLGSAMIDWTKSVAIADVSGDGRPDVIVANGNYTWSYVLLNNGSAPDTWSRMNLSVDVINGLSDLKVADMTGDGRPDIVAVCWQQQNLLLVNNGDRPDTWPQRPLGSVLPDPSGELAMSVDVADMNGDSRPDAIIGSFDIPNSVAINNGGAPETWTRYQLGSPLSDSTMEVLARDLTGDGRPDVLVANTADYAGAQNYVLVNTGETPDLWPRITLGLPGLRQTTDLAVGDLNGDGLPDAVIAGPSGHLPRAFINNGMSPDTWLYTDLPRVSTWGDLAVGDVNGDGRNDLVMANRAKTYALLNNAAVAPYTQAGYHIQVAASSAELTAGNLLWDSGVVESAEVGNGLSTIRQGFVCPQAGSYYWRVKAFSSSGNQSGWSAPQRYDVSGDEAYLCITAPPGLPHAYVANSPCSVSGWASWNVSSVAWTNISNGGNGSLVVDGLWTQNVSLAVGDNELTFTAVGTGVATTQRHVIALVDQAPAIEIAPLAFDEEPAPARRMRTYGDYTTSARTAELFGVVSQQSLAGERVYWTNEATGAAGWVSLLPETNRWPAEGVIACELAIQTDNTIRVWCPTRLGIDIGDSVVIGCYDLAPPALTLDSSLSGQTVYGDALFVSGSVTDNVGIARILWRNLATGQTGESLAPAGSKYMAWQSSLPVAAGQSQTMAVWAEDTFGNVSASGTLSVTHAGVLPEDPGAYPTGAVFVTGLQVCRQWLPATLGEARPSFSWNFADALNTGSVSSLAFATLGDSLADMTFDVDIADLTGDGLPDVVVGNYDAKNYVLVNNGAAPASWSRVNIGSAFSDATHAQAVADVNGDGRPDAMAANYGQNLIRLNNGQAPNTWTRLNLGPETADDSRAIAVGDLTGDGLPEAIIGNSGSESVVLLNNGGSPDAWTRVSLGAAVTYDTRSVVVGDVTGDGLPDVVAGNYGAQNHVLINNGASPDTWTRESLGDGLSDATTALALGDLNGDGRLDVVVGNENEQDYVLWNDGAAPSGWIRQNLGAARSSATLDVKVGDVNGDGQPDVAAAEFQGASSLYLNNGENPAAWTRVQLTAAENGSYACALGDLNGDSRLDLVLGNAGVSGEQNAVMLNTQAFVRYGQDAYRIQVARSTNDLAGGVFNWDSGWVDSASVGDGVSTIRQTIPNLQTGAYVWRMRVLSESRFQSAWSPSTAFVYQDHGYPVVDMTNAAAEVIYDVDQYTLGGRINAHVVGSMSWSNGANGAVGAFASSEPWTVSGVSLAVGTNAVVVTATNAAGIAVSDSVMIVRYGLDTQTPEIHVQTSQTEVEFEDMSLCIEGTNNAGGTTYVSWSNSLTGAHGSFPCGPAWSISDIVLGIGTNEIAFSISNRLGAVSSDSISVVRVSWDMDGDGIPNWWETLHFGGRTNGLAGSDSDGDLVDNYEEWIADSDPNNSQSFLGVELAPLGLNWEASFEASTSRVYTLQYRDDLLGSGWNNIPAMSSVTGTNAHMTLSDTNSTIRRFYRVKVVLP